MKFNKIAKISLIVLICGAVAPAHGMRDGAQQVVQNHPIATAGIAMAPLVLWGGYKLWNYCADKLWWSNLETSIAKSDLEETRKLLNARTNDFLSKIFVTEPFNHFNASDNFKKDTYSKLAEWIVNASGNWCCTGTSRIYKPLNAEEIKKIMTLLFAYKRIDFDDADVCYEIMHDAILGHDVNLIAYLYDQGVKNIWKSHGEFWGAENPIYLICSHGLKKKKKHALFEFFMERIPQDVEPHYFNPPKNYHDHMLSFFEDMLKDMPKSTRSLQLTLACAERHGTTMKYVTSIEEQLQDAGLKKQALDIVAKVQKLDFKKALSVAREKNYSDVEFRFKSE